MEYINIDSYVKCFICGINCLIQIVYKRFVIRNVFLILCLVLKIVGFGLILEEGKNEVDKKGGKVINIEKLYVIFFKYFFFVQYVFKCNCVFLELKIYEVVCFGML